MFLCYRTHYPLYFLFPHRSNLLSNNWLFLFTHVTFLALSVSMFANSALDLPSFLTPHLLPSKLCQLVSISTSYPVSVTAKGVLIGSAPSHKNTMILNSLVSLSVNHGHENAAQSESQNLCKHTKESVFYFKWSAHWMKVSCSRLGSAGGDGGNGSAPHVSQLLPGNSELVQTCSYGDGRGTREKEELTHLISA